MFAQHVGDHPLGGDFCIVFEPGSGTDSASEALLASVSMASINALTSNRCPRSSSENFVHGTMVDLCGVMLELDVVYLGTETGTEGCDAACLSESDELDNFFTCLKCLHF